MAEIVDLAAARRRLQSRTPVQDCNNPEPTPKQQQAAQDWLDMWVPVGSMAPKKRRYVRPDKMTKP
jgi:hypothetical protein